MPLLWRNQCPSCGEINASEKSVAKSMCGEINCGEINVHPNVYPLWALPIMGNAPSSYYLYAARFIFVDS